MLLTVFKHVIKGVWVGSKHALCVSLPGGAVRSWKTTIPPNTSLSTRNYYHKHILYLL